MNRLTGMLMLSAITLATQPAHAADGDAAKIARGKYLVTTSACNDCHTPWHVGPAGPEPDMSRMLSGHPQSLVIEQPAKLPPGPWALAGAPTNTAWVRPITAAEPPARIAVSRPYTMVPLMIVSIS